MSWKTGFAGIVVAMALLAPSSAPAATQTFANPSVKGVRLDWCAHFGTACGQAAADLFCHQNGFSSAQRFAMDPNIGRRGIATLVFGDGRLCSGPNCSGFRAITCAKADAPAVVAAPPAPPLQPIVPPTWPIVPPTRPITVMPPKLAPSGPVASQPSPAGKEKAGPGGLTIAHAQVANLTLTYPDGAWLYHCTSGCEFRLDTDIVMSPSDKFQTVGFTGDVKKIPHAGGFLWQVATAPFPAFGKGTASDVKPPHLVASGTFAGAVHDVPIDFRALAGAGKGPSQIRRLPPGIFYVRIVPVVAPGANVLAGTPSNVIKVYYGEKPPPQPPLKLPSTSPPYLFDVKVVSFTPPDFADPNRWGCVVITGYEPGTSSMIKSLYPPGERCPPAYKGQGHNINSLGDLVDAATGGLTDLWDWVSAKYNGLKKLAVDIAMNYTPFGLQCKAAAEAIGGKDAAGYCRAAAEVGVNAGMAALGLPPSIPDYNQLIDQGVDAAVDLAADQITEQTGIPCVGPCQDALKEGLSAAADNLKKSNDTPGCVGADEAHQNGREPLCLPSGVYAKPAHGAVDQPPLAMIAVTRTQYDRDPASLYKEACYADLAIHFSNIFPAQQVSGPFHNIKDVPTTTIKGDLYNTAGLKLPETMPKGSTKVIPIVFQSAVKFEFGWTHELWQQSEIPARDLLGPMGPDWFTLFSGSTATVTPSVPCGQVAGSIQSQMPKLY